MQFCGSVKMPENFVDKRIGFDVALQVNIATFMYFARPKSSTKADAYSGRI